jgi:uncharacterized protein
MRSNGQETMIGYAALTELLEGAAAPGDASQFHGSLCGACCGAPDAAPALWVERALAGDDAGAPRRLAPERRAELAEVGAQLRAALVRGEMEFAPVLPEDDVALLERALALARWCDAFLYAIALGDAAGLRALEGEAAEVLADFGQIARALDGVNPGEIDTETDSDEGAYVDLVEYVRVGVQLIYEELRQQRERG